MTEDDAKSDALVLATELTGAWLSNPNTRAGAEDVPAFLTRVHAQLGNLSSPQPADEPAAEPEFTPAVSVRKSLASPDHIISMIDGKPYKTLRRHLARHGLTPQQYRERYRLKPDYPMTAESYSKVRQEMAKRIGLGQRGRDAAEAAQEPASEPKPKRGGGRKKGAAGE